MKFFTRLYDGVLDWATHPQALWFLGLLSFSEAVFFPIPPDVMLAPMVLGKPRRAWWLAGLTSVASVSGGVVGFALGYFFFASWIEPMIVGSGYEAEYVRMVEWFRDYGVWIVFAAGFSPLPYKLFTLTAGALNMAFLPFVAASAVSRSARFFLVAGLMKWGGEPMREKLREYIEWIGWAVVALLVSYVVYKTMR